MGSVQNFGEKCPICGKNALATDYYYKTGEDFCTCMHCGYSHKIYIMRDEQGKVIREPKRTIALPCNDLVLAECPSSSQRKAEADFSCMSPIPADMTTDGLYQYLNSPPVGVMRFVYLRQPDGTLQQVSYRLTEMTIENGLFQTSDVCWHAEEFGGYGMLRAESGSSIAWFSLDKSSSIEEMLGTLSAQGDVSVCGVKFSEPGKNPTYYGVTEEEWLKLTVDEDVMTAP